MSKREMTITNSAAAIAVGGFAAMALSLLLSMLLAAVIAAEKLPEQMIQMLAIPVAFASTAVGGVTAAGSIGKRVLPMIAGVFTLYACAVLAARGFFFHGTWRLTPIVSAFAGAVLSCLIMTKKRKRKRAR